MDDFAKPMATYVRRAMHADLVYPFSLKRLTPSAVAHNNKQSTKNSY
jgi:hypothetical protein